MAEIGEEQTDRQEDGQRHYDTGIKSILWPEIRTYIS